MAEAIISVEEYGEAIGRETITVDATAGGKALSASAYESAYSDLDSNVISKKRADVAHLVVQTQPIRVLFTPMGTVTAANGFPLLAGQTLIIQGYSKIVTLRLIRSGGVSATVEVAYFKK